MSFILFLFKILLQLIISQQVIFTDQTITSYNQLGIKQDVFRLFVTNNKKSQEIVEQIIKLQYNGMLYNRNQTQYQYFQKQNGQLQNYQEYYQLDIDPTIIIINCTDMNKNFCREIQMLPQMISDEDPFPAFATEQSIGRFTNNSLQQIIMQLGESTNKIHQKNIQLAYNENNQNKDFFIVKSSEYKNILDEYIQTFAYQYEQLENKQDIQQLLQFINNPVIYNAQIKVQNFKNKYQFQLRQQLKMYKNVIQIQPSTINQLQFYTDQQYYFFNISLDKFKTEDQIFQKIQQYIKLYKQKRILGTLQQQDILSLESGEKLIVAQLIDGYSKLRLEKLLHSIQYDGCPIYYLKDKIDKQSRDKLQQQIPGTDFYILYYKHPKQDKIIQYVSGDRYRTNDYYTVQNYQLSDNEFDKMNQNQLQMLQKTIEKLNKVKPQKTSDFLHVQLIYKDISTSKKLLIVTNFWLILFGVLKISSSMKVNIIKKHQNQQNKKQESDKNIKLVD